MEGGVLFLVDLETWEYYWYTYAQVGGGWSLSYFGIPVAGAGQIEIGVLQMDVDINPSKMSVYSFTITGYAAGRFGLSGQVTWPFSGGSGATGGFCVGWGASINAMGTRSWYQGSGSVVPDYIKQLLDK